MTTKKTAKARKATIRSASPDDMRPEYDFRGAVRGKYAARYPQGSLVVTLAPDVAAAYPSATAANDALRELIRGGKKPSSRGGRSA